LPRTGPPSCRFGQERKEAYPVRKVSGSCPFGDSPACGSGRRTGVDAGHDFFHRDR
jgi:hypothetical protein